MSERILKDITFGSDAKKLLLSGLTKSSDLVGSTYGYRGKNVLKESDFGQAESTKDGFNTLDIFYLENPVENLAVEVAKQASKKTVDFSGDATSSTIILLKSFFENSIKAKNQGKSQIDIKQKIEKSRDLILNHLDEISTPITDKLIYDVALTSANGDVEIAKLVSKAYIKAGADGSVSHTRSNTDESDLDFIEGILVESAYSDERFVNVFSDRTCVFDERPLIVCSTIEFKTVKQILPFMQYAHDNKRPLVIIADCAPAVKDVVLQNVIQKKVPFCIVHCPGAGKKRLDFINDLACVLGTQAITTLSGDNFEGREGEFIGECEKIVVGKTDTIITPIKNEYIQKIVDGKIAEIKETIKTTKSQTEEKYLRQRISKLVGGISIIKVGSIIESELGEKIDRVEDAVCAVRSAKEEGVLPGGGIALFSALKLDLDPVTRNSIIAPICKLLDNADVKHNLKLNWFERLFKKPLITQAYADFNLGYDVKNFRIIDMYEAGIVDSNKAIKNSLINSTSASNTLFMTDFVISNKRFV